MSETLSTKVRTPELSVSKPAEVFAQAPEAQTILGRLYNAEPLTDEPEIPLSGLERLRKKLFLATTNLKNGPPDVIVNASNHEEPIQVPLDLVVDAQGFVSWEGRGAKVNKTIMTDEGYKTLPSREVIELYASMGKNAPIIPAFDLFIQLDGKIFLANSNDGSHRLAAAILRGDKSVPTLSLRVRQLDENIF